MTDFEKLASESAEMAEFREKWSSYPSNQAQLGFLYFNMTPSNTYIFHCNNFFPLIPARKLQPKNRFCQKSLILEKLGQLYRDPLKDDGRGLRAVRKLIGDAEELARYTTGTTRDALLEDAGISEDLTDIGGSIDCFRELSGLIGFRR